MKRLLAALALVPALACASEYPLDPAAGTVERAKAIAAERHGGIARIADTGSMEPLLTGHSIVVFVPGLPVRPGVIVLFRGSNGRLSGEPVAHASQASAICHRVVRSSGVPGNWVTRGDAMRNEDADAVGPRQIIGVVVAVIDSQTGEARDL